MASPVAHTLAGAAVYLLVRRRNARWDDPLLYGCILAANLSDLDFLPGLLAGDRELFHRGFSHSIGFSLVVGVLAALAARRRSTRRRLALSAVVAIAVATHLLIDWATWDASLPAGIPLLWPWDETHYMAAHTWFLNVERRQWWTLPVMAHNLCGALRELAILGPPVLALWFYHRWHRPPPPDRPSR